MRLKVTKTNSNTSYYAIIDVKLKNGKRTTKIYKRLGDEQEILKISNGIPALAWAQNQVAELKKHMKKKL